jgi:hypothetical protein
MEIKNSKLKIQNSKFKKQVPAQSIVPDEDDDGDTTI